MKNSIERTRPFKIALIYKRMYKSKRARRRLNFGIFRCFFAIKMRREARKKRKKRKKGGSNSRKAQRILNDVYENGGVEEERPWFCKRSTSWLVSARVTRAARFHACPPSFSRLTTICWRACQRFSTATLPKRMKIALDRRTRVAEIRIFHFSTETVGLLDRYN